MPKYLHLDIPKPCHEDWNKMSPEAQGRFCSSCQKTVTDFTGMSDAQLVAFFKNPKPSVCGRFTQDQLERDISIPRKRIPWLKYFFQFTLPAFLWSLKSSGQTMGKIAVAPPVEKIAVEKSTKLLGDTIATKEIFPPVSQQLVGRVGGVSYSVDRTRYIGGRVTDYEGNPLPGASITVKGTNSAIATDSSGYFLLANVPKKARVVASFIGYESKEVVVTNKSGLLNIQLGSQSLGEVVVVAGYVVPERKNKTSKKEVCIKPAVTPLFSIYPNPVQRSSSLHFKWQSLEPGNYHRNL